MLSNCGEGMLLVSSERLRTISKSPTMYSINFYSKEISDPKCSYDTDERLIQTYVGRTGHHDCRVQ